MKKIADKTAEYLITIAGVAVIAAMFAMLALIVREAAPLFFPASQTPAGVAALPAGVAPDDVAAMRVDADLHGRVRAAGIVLRDGTAGFAVHGGAAADDFALSRLPGAPDRAKAVSVANFADGTFSILWDNGSLALYAMTANFDTATYAFTLRAETAVDTGAGYGFPLFAMLRGDAERRLAVAVYPGGRTLEKRTTPAKGLRAGGKSVDSERIVLVGRGGSVTAAALNDAGALYLGTDGGAILSVDLSRDGDIPVDVTPVFRDRRAVTALSFLNGGYALAVGDANGGVSVWFPRRENGVFHLRQSVAWEGEGEGGAVREFAASGRDRGVIALAEDGGLRWFYSTTGKELLAFPAGESPVRSLALNARSDTMATLSADGQIAFRALDSSYPEAGWAGFFRRLLYEGYETIAYVWQSTGSDASEPKLSLVPLIWGSVKAAVYALMFATPIALAAAMYLSQFANPLWRARLKPAVEMVAAVPSVVIGFIAALWLAPLLERHMQFFARNFPYDQRNSLVIAIAMGFAVIPTVFSLAEDAISAVPPSLSAASLALGASKWQTVVRVVLPTASPGIFTAVMLGFGRAVGETMIVLMAAGNTPIISLSPFNGMRTLSANIAVEMPEAPVGGTLYRTLFLCALILFVLTLAINTAAEVFRHRLRNRYGKV